MLQTQKIEFIWMTKKQQNFLLSRQRCLDKIEEIRERRNGGTLPVLIHLVHSSNRKQKNYLKKTQKIQHTLMDRFFQTKSFKGHPQFQQYNDETCFPWKTDNCSIIKKEYNNLCKIYYCSGLLLNGQKSKTSQKS